MNVADTRTVKISITNIFGGGDYTAQILVGSANSPANVILDTGSSTLAVKETAYNPQHDKNLKPTTFAQDITYGTGGWAGPVVLTSVTMGVEGNNVTLNQAPLAITADQQQGNFGQADGILGLAYHVLNNGYDLQNFLAQHGIDPPVTYPWPPFRIQDTTIGIRQFQRFLATQPKKDITPYFTELEENGITANKFAFYTLRSSVNVTSGRETVADALKDPLNQGLFILGGGEEETELYEGSFKTVKVLHDAYYNTNLKYAQVDGGDRVQALALQSQYQPYAFTNTNSIVDSGTNSLALSYNLYQGLFKSLGNLNPRFAEIINEFNQLISQRDDPQGFPVDKLNLQEWPNINFVLEGENGEDVTLTCSPQTYWQVNSPSPGQAFFKMSGSREFTPQGAPTPNQSILGLPLMNNYYTVFDRSTDRMGVIKFATIKPPSA